MTLLASLAIAGLFLWVEKKKIIEICDKHYQELTKAEEEKILLNKQIKEIEEKLKQTEISLANSKKNNGGLTDKQLREWFLGEGE